MSSTVSLVISIFLGHPGLINSMFNSSWSVVFPFLLFLFLLLLLFECLHLMKSFNSNFLFYFYNDFVWIVLIFSVYDYSCWNLPGIAEYLMERGRNFGGSLGFFIQEYQTHIFSTLHNPLTASFFQKLHSCPILYHHQGSTSHLGSTGPSHWLLPCHHVDQPQPRVYRSSFLQQI